MTSGETGTGYKLWGADDVVYGPVELPTLVEWVKDERVLRGSWIFVESQDQWHKAGELAELGGLFPGGDPPPPADSALQIKPGALRRVRLFADFQDAQLEQFGRYFKAITVSQWQEVVRQGEHGDSMFLILEGELRVRLMIDGRESLLATLGAGEFFGEVSLFDQGPRSADVVANRESYLLIITAADFQKIMASAPALAAPFLFTMGKTMNARIRLGNKRYRDSIAFARGAR